MYRYCAVLCLSGFVILLSLFLTACGKNGEAKDNSEEEIVSIPVEVAEVFTDEIAASLTGTATLEAEQEAEVVAKTSEIVRDILVEEGMAVKKGQVLARLEGEMLAIEAAQAKADINKLENDFNRSKELFDKNLISKEEFQNVRFQYEAQEAAYEKAKLNLEYTTIRAPIAGVVATRYIKVGNMVNINQPVFKIVDFDPLIARLFVPEAEINKIRIGLRAQLNLEATNGTTFEGEVIRISPIVDPQSGTVKVTIAVKGENQYLKPGMFTRIKLIYDTHKNSLLVPKHAVIVEDDRKMVFAIQDSLAIRKTVTTGFANERYYEILEGLGVGDEVVVVGQNGLKDSSRVEVIR